MKTVPGLTPFATNSFSRNCAVLMLSTVLPLGFAQAACSVAISNPNLNLGNSTVGALAPSEVSGYRRMGARQVNITGSCDRSLSAIRLAFEGLESLPSRSDGQVVTQWSGGAAMLFRASSATVGGLPVRMAIIGAPKTGFNSSVDLTQNSVIDFDLGRIPQEARKSFALQVDLTALVPERYAPRSKMMLDRHFSVRLLSSD